VNRIQRCVQGGLQAGLSGDEIVAIGQAVRFYNGIRVPLRHHTEHEIDDKRERCPNLRLLA